MLALKPKVNAIPYQTQQTTNFVDGSYAAEEAHGHWQGTHSDEDVGSYFHRVGWFLWREQVQTTRKTQGSTHTEPQKTSAVSAIQATSNHLPQQFYSNTS